MPKQKSRLRSQSRLWMVGTPASIQHDVPLWVEEFGPTGELKAISNSCDACA